MHDEERWADLPGYEGLYQVSDRGRVFNHVRRKFLQGTVTKKGYRQVMLTSAGRGRFYLVHALVLTAFVCPRPPGLVCDHISANRLENSLANLEWVTQLENVRRAARAGRLRSNPARGEEHYASKLSREQVETIRTLHERGTATRLLALEYRVSRNAIVKVVKRTTWKHVV